MRLKNAILCLFLVVAFSAQAQQFQREFSFGVNGGLLMSQVNFVPKVKEKMFMGVNGGITARYVSEKHFGVQGELNFSQRGWDEKADNYSYSRTLNYIELPILTHLYFGKRKLRFIINLGPKVAYLIGDSENTDMDDLSSHGQSKSIKYKFDYGLCGGGGFEFRTGRINYILEGRYYFGLADLFANSRSDDFLRSAHRDISVNLTLLFGKKK